MILNEIVAYIGKTGSGKSYLALYHLVDQLEKGRNVVVIDFKKGANGCGEYEELNEWCTYLPVGDKMFRRLNKQTWIKILLRYPKLRVHQLGLTFEELRGLIDDISGAINEVGDRLLVIEEAHLFAPNHKIPENLQRLITGGRTDGIDTWFVIQRPALMDVTPLSQAHMMYIFQLTDKNDLDRMASVIGINRDDIVGLGRCKCKEIDLIRGTSETIDTMALKTKVEHHG